VLQTGSDWRAGPVETVVKRDWQSVYDLQLDLLDLDPCLNLVSKLTTINISDQHHANNPDI